MIAEFPHQVITSLRTETYHRIPKIAERLGVKKSAIFRTAIEQYVEKIQAVTEATEDMYDDAHRFVYDETIAAHRFGREMLVSKPGSRITKGALYAAYKEWHADNGSGGLLGAKSYRPYSNEIREYIADCFGAGHEANKFYQDVALMEEQAGLSE